MIKHEVRATRDILYESIIVYFSGFLVCCVGKRPPVSAFALAIFRCWNEHVMRGRKVPTSFGERLDVRFFYSHSRSLAVMDLEGR